MSHSPENFPEHAKTHCHQLRLRPLREQVKFLCGHRRLRFVVYVQSDNHKLILLYRYPGGLEHEDVHVVDVQVDRPIRVTGLGIYGAYGQPSHVYDYSEQNYAVSRFAKTYALFCYKFWVKPKKAP